VKRNENRGELNIFAEIGCEYAICINGLGDGRPWLSINLTAAWFRCGNNLCPGHLDPCIVAVTK